MTDCLVHLDLVEVNALLEMAHYGEDGVSKFDKKDMHGDDPDIFTESETLYNACEFILRAFGKEFV